MKRPYLLLFAILPLLQGCPAAFFAGAVATGAVAYDRRTAGTVLDDQLIELKAMNRFYADEELSRKAHIGVVSYNNIVLLTGEAPTEELKRRAEAIVRSIPKVRGVHNEIRIAAPSSLAARSADAMITAKVKAEMVAKGFDALRVKVVTSNGTVYLMGLVTHEEAEKATEIARQVGGVQKVVKLFEYID